MASSQSSVVLRGELSRSDVLFGRGRDAVNARGNVTFRNIIWEHKDEYQQTISSEAKRIIAERVMRLISELLPPGRFLAKTPNGDYSLVPRERAFEKVAQTLRSKMYRKPPSCPQMEERKLMAKRAKRKQWKHKARERERVRKREIESNKQKQPLPKPSANAVTGGAEACASPAAVIKTGISKKKTKTTSSDAFETDHPKKRNMFISRKQVGVLKIAPALLKTGKMEAPSMDNAPKKLKHVPAQIKRMTEIKRPGSELEAIALQPNSVEKKDHVFVTVASAASLTFPVAALDPKTLLETLPASITPPQLINGAMENDRFARQTRAFPKLASTRQAANAVIDILPRPAPVAWYDPIRGQVAAGSSPELGKPNQSSAGKVNGIAGVPFACHKDPQQQPPPEGRRQCKVGELSGNMPPHLAGFFNCLFPVASKAASEVEIANGELVGVADAVVPIVQPTKLVSCLSMVLTEEDIAALETFDPVAAWDDLRRSG